MQAHKHENHAADDDADLNEATNEVGNRGKSVGTVADQAGRIFALT
jgi:hypothetical protein